MAIYCKLFFYGNCNLIITRERLTQCEKYYCPTIRLLFKMPLMASNSGTGLIVGNGKQNQLYRASNAVYQPQKHGVNEITVQKCSDIILSVPLTSTIINQRAIHPRRCKFAESSNRRRESRDVANSR